MESWRARYLRASQRAFSLPCLHGAACTPGVVPRWCLASPMCLGSTPFPRPARDTAAPRAVTFVAPSVLSYPTHRFEEDFPGAVRCALTETHRLPAHLLRSATGLMRAGGLVPLLNRRMRTKRHTPGEAGEKQALVGCLATPRVVRVKESLGIKPAISIVCVLCLVCALEQMNLVEGGGGWRDVMSNVFPSYSSCFRHGVSMAHPQARDENTFDLEPLQQFQYVQEVCGSVFRCVTPSLPLLFLALPLRVLQGPLCGRRACGIAARRASGFPWRPAR